MADTMNREARREWRSRIERWKKEIKRLKIFFLTDNDGCILSTEELIHAPAWRMYAKFWYPNADPQKVEEWFAGCRGCKTEDSVIRALEMLGSPRQQFLKNEPGWVEGQVEHKENCVEKCLPKECPFNTGAEETLKFWNRLGLPWGMVTSASEFLKYYIRMYKKFRRLIDLGVAVTPDMVKHGKPDPEPFLKGAERVKAKFGLKNDALMFGIEDAASGVRSLIAAGAHTIIVIGDAITQEQREEFSMGLSRIIYANEYGEGFNVFLDINFLEMLLVNI